MSPIQNPIPDSYNDMGAAALVNQSKTNYVIILYGYISYDETIQGLEKKKKIFSWDSSVSPIGAKNSFSFLHFFCRVPKG